MLRLPLASSFRWPTLLAAFLALALAACDNPVEVDLDDGTRGAVTAATRLVEQSRDDLLQAYPTAQVGVTLYRVVYRTEGLGGGDVEASALVVLPQDVDTAPLMSYQHGTLTARDEVPSVAGLAAGETGVGLFFGAAGYVTVLPDYLGLGVSDDTIHPYLHAASQATAVRDALRAARRLAEREGIDLTGPVYLMGYSQGGHATLAAQRLLETEHADEFTVAASAPMAGPYDLSGTMAEALQQRVAYGSPLYVPYLLLGLDAVYDLFDDPSDVFVAPYDARLPVLFDGTFSGDAINAELPEVPVDVLQPDYLAAFEQDADHPLRAALRDNDVIGWTPDAPVRLYHCTGDPLVPFANSEVAYADFDARGADVTLVALEGDDHAGCAPGAFFLAYGWFNSLRTDVSFDAEPAAAVPPGLRAMR